MITPFTVQKVSNHGVSNPIVARLSIQTHKLAPALWVGDEKRGEIQKQYFELQRRLLNCHDIHVRLNNAKADTLAETARVLAEGNRTAPHVIGLQEEIENFLFATKTYLREVTVVLNLLFETKFANDSAIFWNPKGRDSEVGKWALETFGPDHTTTKMLQFDASWIGEIIRKRNAVEHPGGRSGTLIVTNFEQQREGLMPPLWSRTGDMPTDIYHDLPILMENLLTFAEDLLVEAIRAKQHSRALDFALIPEKDRDNSCPIRLALHLRTDGK